MIKTKDCPCKSKETFVCICTGKKCWPRPYCRKILADDSPKQSLHDLTLTVVRV